MQLYVMSYESDMLDLSAYGPHFKTFHGVEMDITIPTLLKSCLSLMNSELEAVCGAASSI